MHTFSDIVKYKEPVVRDTLGKLFFLPQVMSLLTFGERLGLILLAQTSAVSAFAVVGLLSYIAYSAVSVTRGSSIRWRLRYPIEVYFLNQLSWDLVQAIGGLMNIKWAMDAVRNIISLVLTSS